MANVNSLTTNSSSNMSSLYGSRNVLSGLASGLDTESMIENSVSGYKTKITELEKQQTKYQWKQDAYRSITDKMYDLTQKYTSYTSKTNLYSEAFFNSSISTESVGTYADKVSATGRSSSDIQILAAEVATAAHYEVSVGALGLNASNNATNGMTAAADWNDPNITVGTLKGTMTLNYDGQKIDITFDETDHIGDGTNGTKTLVDAVQEKLKDVTINTKFGTQKASEVISVSASGGNITFGDIGGRGATPYISYVDSNLKDALGATERELYAGSSTKQYTFTKADKSFTDTKTAAEYLAGKDINVTIDGVTKSFRLDKDTLASGNIKKAFEDGLKSVGLENVVTVSAVTDGNGDPTGELSFSVNNTSSQFSISSKDAKANEILGFGDGISNYLSEKTSIGTLLGSAMTGIGQENDTEIIARLQAQNSANGAIITDAETGNRYKNDNGAFYRVNDKDETLHKLTINGKSIYVSEDASLQSVLDNINGSDMGVNATFSKLTGKFVLTAKETGANSQISFDNDLAQSLFTATKQKTDGAGNPVMEQVGKFTDGKDAAVRALVNDSLVTLVRSSNTFDMDGMSVTLKGDFNEGQITKVSGTDKVDFDNQPSVTSDEKANAVSFSTSAGSDELIKTIKEFIDEYNAIMKEVHDAYATQPAEKNSTKHTRYEPLTDDDKNGMSEKAIENYEAKAKQGILFGDSDLRTLYESMVSAFSPGGADGAALREMGIETTYSSGLTQITLDESKFRDAFNKDPDSVRAAFTKSKESGASTNGLMTSIKNTMEQYASASYANPGILVSKAGSTHNSYSLLNNDMQKQLDNVQTKIEQWQTKMGTKIDYYTRQFTALEKLMNTMNSQSSALAGLMGG